MSFDSLDVGFAFRATTTEDMVGRLAEWSTESVDLLRLLAPLDAVAVIGLEEGRAVSVASVVVAGGRGRGGPGALEDHCGSLGRLLTRAL